MNEPTSGLVDWVLAVMASLGYLGVALLVALESVFPPIPSEVVLPLAGVAASRGELWLPAVVAAATAGSIAGAMALYSLGRYVGRERLRQLVRRYGSYLLVGEHDLERAEDWFERHGSEAVLLGRLIPTVRSVISIPAGIAAMPLPRFIAYTAFGSALWNTILVGAGWVLGKQWHLVRRYTEYLHTALLVLFVAFLVWLLWRRLRTP